MGGGFSATTVAGGAERQGDYRYGHGAAGMADDDDDADEDLATGQSNAVCSWVGKSLPQLPLKPMNAGAHFQIHSVLGTGMLGRVRLVQHKKLKTYFAIKSMHKKQILSQTMLRHIECERDAHATLTKLQHPFLAKFFGSFQTSSHVHFVLEYAPGGELLHRLHQVGGKFTHHEAKFYATELVAFIAFLHSQRYMYRDLKPENVLLDARGHIKVVDLGFVRKLADPSERCSTSVGTPQYLAPEQLTQSKDKRQYTCIVDWWALACVVFEMVAGHTPFDGAGSSTTKDNESPFVVYTRILQGKIQWPRGLSGSLKDLLRQMLTPDPSKRLCDREAIQQHAWFSDVDWLEVVRAEVKPPFRPMLKIEGDRSCFDEYPDDDREDASGDSGAFSTKAAMAFANEFRNF